MLPVATMDLLYELLLVILSTQDKQSLKTARLVSHAWCTCASVFLFEEVYVSATMDDLEIFEAISRSPLLSSSVRHLRYDATEFVFGLSLERYICELVWQTIVSRDAEAPSFWDPLDDDVKDWISVLHDNTCRACDSVQRFENCTFIHEGFRNYRSHANYQYEIIKNRSFIDRLSQSLERLEALTSISVEDSWKTVGIYSVPCMNCQFRR